MVRPRGRPSMGRQRIPIDRIDNRERRQVTFSKRHSGLFKKASEISLLCDARIAVVMFSEAGRVFAFGSPSVDTVLHRYVPLPGHDGAPVPAPDDIDIGDDRETLQEICRATEERKKQVAAEIARMNAIEEKVVLAQGGRRFWWEADVQALGEAELPEFARALQRLKDNVRRRAETLRSALGAAAASAPATADIVPAAHGDASFN